ncbi:MAG TPA: hypothetical protein VJN96_04960 [Vicinamibacterales bacterium]|nr:hypothetical protein [Vicinamibacterales bacterium]
MLFRLACILAALLLPSASAVTQQTATETSASSRVARWREDLTALAREFPEKQFDFSKLYPNRTFQSGLAAIERNLTNSSDADVVLGLMRLVATPHVGHTNVQLPSTAAVALRRLPVAFTWFAEGLAVTAATDPLRSAIGRRVVRIGTLSPEELEAAVAPFISYENQPSLRQQSPTFMATEEVLRAIGQIGADGRVAMVLAGPEGQTETISVAPDPSPRPILVTAYDALKIPIPLARRQPNAYYWFEYLSDAKALYVQYNRCANDPAKPFADFARDLFAFADAHPVDRVVVDLRYNGGGDSRVITPLVDGLRSRKPLTRHGHLFALTGRATFSSGLRAVRSFRQDLGAILIGEQPGEKPNSYTEVGTIVLPNSKVVVQYSTKFNHLVSGDPSTFDPDVPVPRTLSELLTGRDAVLESALRYKG